MFARRAAVGSSGKRFSILPFALLWRIRRLKIFLFSDPFAPDTFEFENASIGIDGGDPDTNPVSEAELVVGSETGKRPGGAIELVFVVGQFLDGDQAFCGQIDALGKDPKGLDARDHGVHFHADFIVEVVEQFQFFEFPFGLFGSPFEIAAMDAEAGESVETGNGSFAIDEVADHPVNDQVGIPANG